MMPHQPDADELLDYQTEQETPEEVAPITPIPVCVYEPVVTVPTVPQHATCYTVVVATDATVGPAYAQLLPNDPLRVAATVYTSTTAAVICHSRNQAQDPTNQVTGVPNPDGAYLPTDKTVVITGTQQMWVAATGATASKVSVIVERRTA